MMKGKEQFSLCVLRLKFSQDELTLYLPQRYIAAFFGNLDYISIHITKTLQHHKATDDIHVSSKKLMSELNKAGAPYSLSLANRLYGEQTYQFVEVRSQDRKLFKMIFLQYTPCIMI